MDRIFINSRYHSTPTNFAFGKGDTVPIDQTPSASFNIDPSTGHPLSDITAIVRADNKFEQERMLANLVKYESEFLPPDANIDDVLKYSQPRLAQMPSELAELTEKFTKSRYDEAKAEYERKLKEEELKFYEEQIKAYDSNKKSKAVVDVEPKNE